MSNQTWNNDPDKPKDSGDGQDSGPYSAPGDNVPDQGTPGAGYTPPGWEAPTSPTPSGSSGSDAPSGGYQPPSWEPGQASSGSGADAPTSPTPSGTGDSNASQGGYTAPGYGQGYSAPSGAEAQGGYSAPGYGQGYSAPSGADPSQPGYGQAPGTPDQSFGQTPSYGAPTQGGYDPNAGGNYGQSPYGGAPQGGYDPNTGAAYGAAPQGGYGAPSPYGGGYQPNPYAPSGPILATWGRRAIGGLIDFVAPAIAISIIINIVMPNGGYGATILSTLLAVGWWVYNTGYRVATTGYSFGHKIGKVRVVMEDTGQTPPQNTAMLRAVAHLLDELVCFLGFLFPIWDSKKQTFADKIAKTVVIDEQNTQR